MLWLVHSAWRYRKGILLGVAVVAELRKTAKDFTKEYIRRRVKEGLALGMALVLAQVVLLMGALLLVALHPTLLTRLIGSAVLWVLTVYNLHRFFTATIPELFAVRKTLKGKMGYAMKYFLRISLITELLQWNLLMPALCLIVAAATRTGLGMRLSYFVPWVDAYRLLSNLQ